MTQNPTSDRSIFLAAVDIASPAERDAFVARACGDNAPLRSAVQALLAAHGQSGDLLDAPDQLPPTIERPLAERPGVQIGPYKLLQQIGEGGFGIVFMAEQLEPVRRRVALKVIKPGMDTRQVIARFEAERQALAVMDHPNIARVLDAGATESGRPYFVMELVRGTPITAYCDENSLPIRERLALFASVCQAIQHAHTKGIIHRDIKPTNVLVTRQDGQPVVKVIDFGIAKAMGQQLTDKTLFTEFAQMIGTPHYMSPEQAELSSTDIDTRSDIYSLGVLLYELLTGSTPVSKEQLKKAAFDEIRRIIREDEPPRPSTRISTAAAASSIAAQRHTEPAKLARLVRGELDWIVMKALEKDRRRRYETASAFAADVLHYLADEPVVACPPSAAYRLRKFVRRQKWALTTATLVVTAVLAGTAVSLWQAIAATAARKLAEVERRRAEEDFEKSLTLVDRILTRVGYSPDGLPDRPQMLHSMNHGPGGDDPGDGIMASSFTDPPFAPRSALGAATQIEESRQQILDDALDFYRGFVQHERDNPHLQHRVAVMHRRAANICAALGRIGERNAAFQQARETLEELHRRHPDNDEFTMDLADVYNNFGWLVAEQAAEKEKHHRQAEALLVPLFERSQDLKNDRQQLVSSQLANTRSSIGRLLAYQGRTEEAEACLHDAILMCQDDPDWGQDVLATAYHGLGVLLATTKRITEAVEALDKAIRVRLRVVAKSPQSAFYRGELASDYQYQGDLLVQEGRYQEAVTAYRKAVKEAGDVATAFRDDARLGQMHLPLLKLLRMTGQNDEAQALSGKVVGIADRLAGDTAQELLVRGLLYEAAEDFRRALDDYEAAVRQQPTDGAAQLHLFPLLLWKEPRARDGERSLKIAKELTNRAPSVHSWFALGWSHNHLGQYREAIASFRRALEFEPTNDAAYARIADAHLALGENRQALAVCDEGIQKCPHPVAIWASRGSIFDNLGEYEKAVADYSRALQNSPPWWLYKRRALAYFKLSRYDDALADIASAVELKPHDFSNLTWIPPSLVANCDDKRFQEGLLKLAERTVELLNGNPAACLAQVKLKVSLGMKEAAQVDFEQAISRMDADSMSVVDLNHAAWLVAMSPQFQRRHIQLAVAWSEAALRREPGSASFWNTLGVAQYRAEDWNAAIEALEKSMELRKGGDSYDWFILAMAHWQFGNKDEARKRYDQAVQWMEKNQPENEELRRFRAEAEELLGINRQTAPKDNLEPRANN